MILHRTFISRIAYHVIKSAAMTQVPSREASARAQATRRSILDAACSCFAEFGFAGTSTRKIAERARVTQPLIHHYFKTKQALFDAVLDDAVQDYEQAQAELWELDALDPRNLTLGLSVMFDWIGAHPRVLRLMTWARLEGKVAPRKSQKALIERVYARFEAAKQAGILRANTDILMTMMAIDLLFKGYWGRNMPESEVYRSQSSGPEFRAQLIEFIIRAIVVEEHQAGFIEKLPRE